MDTKEKNNEITAITKAPKSRGVNVNIDELLAQAISKGAGLETLEKLLAMRKELKMEYAKEQFDAALASFQSECPVIKKERKVDFVGKTSGVRVKYAYAPLDEIVEQVKGLIAKNGLSYTIDMENTETSITAIVKVRHIAGHSEITKFTVPIDKNAYMSAQQQYGAASTFAKRYCFCNAFGILTGDEDTDATPDSIGNEGIMPKTPQPKNINNADILTVRGAKLHLNETVKHIRSWVIDVISRNVKKKDGTKANATDYILSDDKSEFATMTVSVWGEPIPDIIGKEADFFDVKIMEYKGEIRGHAKSVKI